MSVFPAPEIFLEGRDVDHPEDSRALAVECTSLVHLYHVPDSDVVALRGVDLDIDPGEMVALLGPSGMGKSTLLKIMAGMLRPSAGQVLVGGRDVARMSQAELRRYRAVDVGIVLQDPLANVLPYATVVENIEFAGVGAKAYGSATLPVRDCRADGSRGVRGATRHPPLGRRAAALGRRRRRCRRRATPPHRRADEPARRRRAGPRHRRPARPPPGDGRHDRHGDPRPPPGRVGPPHGDDPGRTGRRGRSSRQPVRRRGT